MKKIKKIIYSLLVILLVPFVNNCCWALAPSPQYVVSTAFGKIMDFLEISIGIIILIGFFISIFLLITTLMKIKQISNSENNLEEERKKLIKKKDILIIITLILGILLLRYAAALYIGHHSIEYVK